jgi:hypothetical protein
MKPLKLIVTLAATICALSNAHAQLQTNAATFNATMILQGPMGPTSAVTLNSPLNTAGLIAELGTATGNTFSKAAKLQAISSDSTQFAVVDGANTVLISTGIMSMNPTSGNSIVSGKETNTSLHEKELMLFDLSFNDVGMGATDLQFTLRGIGSITISDTMNSSSTSAKIPMVGEGSQGGTNFVITANLSGSGH